METIPQDTKRVFRKLGACSHTFFYLLNRAFGHLAEPEERAAAPFVGGILQQGYQCGMLWGSALAVGAEAFRRSTSHDQALALAITATQYLVRSFSDRTHTVNCRDITETDFSKKWQMAKFLLFKARHCFNLAEQWAPEAIQAAAEGLSREPADLPQPCMSCASEVARKMGASEEEMATVAGFAGGLGLSGNACGALSAAIWMHALAWSREHPGKSPFDIPTAKNILEAFRAATNSEMLCHKITGRHFNSIPEHTEFIKSGGCEKLLDLLAEYGKEEKNLQPLQTNHRIIL